MWDWTWKRWIIFLVPFLLIGIAAVVWLFMRKTLRTRLRMEGQLRDDPDINEWLVVFNWSRKVLYFPMVIVSVVACVLMYLKEGGAWASLNERILGGVWLGMFILNFLVDEYEVSLKVLLIFILCALALFLWLAFLDWFDEFIYFFRVLGITISGTGYLVLALVFMLAIAISWLRGLFYYVAITPNYLNIQVGPTETGEQISREEYSTRIDTGDFLERLLGFGRLVITFADHRRQPVLLLISRIGKKARRLESVRGKLALDRHQPAREGGSAGPIL